MIPKKALDPPGPEVVEDALNFFSLSFDASVLVVKFGEVGMLREGILLGILMDTQPLPILHPFGDEHLDKHRLEHLKRLLKFEEMEPATLLPPKLEEEWCSFHHLVQSSLTMSLNVKCVAVPFVASDHFQTNDVAENLENTIKKIRVQYVEDISGNHQAIINDYDSHVNGGTPLCVYFVDGRCDRDAASLAHKIISLVWFLNTVKMSLQVEKLARDSFFLIESFPFDQVSFRELLDTVTLKKPMLASMLISYVFDLHPPSDIQFGDCLCAS
ncbi:hypothetical protein CRYUN_Cryun01aG0187700 [Craigia yunnanensis]